MNSRWTRFLLPALSNTFTSKLFLKKVVTGGVGVAGGTLLAYTTFTNANGLTVLDYVLPNTYAATVSEKPKEDDNVSFLGVNM